MLILVTTGGWASDAVEAVRFGAGAGKGGSLILSRRTNILRRSIGDYCRESRRFNQCTLSRSAGFSDPYADVKSIPLIGATGRFGPPFPFNRRLRIGQDETFVSKKSFSLTVPILPNYTRSPAGRIFPHGNAHVSLRPVSLPSCVSPLSHLFAAVTR